MIMTLTIWTMHVCYCDFNNAIYWFYLLYTILCSCERDSIKFIINRLIPRAIEQANTTILLNIEKMIKVKLETITAFSIDHNKAFIKVYHTHIHTHARTHTYTIIFIFQMKSYVLITQYPVYLVRSKGFTLYHLKHQFIPIPWTTWVRPHHTIVLLQLIYVRSSTRKHFITRNKWDW